MTVAEAIKSTIGLSDSNGMDFDRGQLGPGLIGGGIGGTLKYRHFAMVG